MSIHEKRVKERILSREIFRAQTTKYAMPGSSTMGMLLISEVLDDILRELASLRLDTEAKSETEADLGEVAENGTDQAPESDAGAPAEKNNGVTENGAKNDGA